MESKGRKLVTMFVASAALLGLSGCDAAVDDDDDIDVKIKAKTKKKEEKKQESVSNGTSSSGGVSSGKKLQTTPSTKSSGG